MTQRIITIDTSLNLYTDNPTKKLDRINYRELKKELNRYYKFGFTMPRKGKDFNPQQKAVLRKRLETVKSYITKSGELKQDEVSFIPYPKKGENKKLKDIDAIRTNKGIIYKYPNARLKLDKKENVNRLLIIPKKRADGAIVRDQRKEVLYIFPERIQGNPEQLQEYVEYLREKYSPDDIRFSTHNMRSTVRYDAKYFEFYFVLYEFDDPSEVPDDIIDYFDEKGTPLDEAAVWKARKMRKTTENKKDFYNGVFLIYYVNESGYTKKPATKKQKSKQTAKQPVKKPAKGQPSDAGKKPAKAKPKAKQKAKPKAKKKT